ncbi:hypothetical protein BJ138DRAFT_1119693 [Hygrophoropsis aurantiaca]|uniref:Uncharacterized protein n=1 Tax=Hygrophoropsis aurantiaca TaxID=72124 RepID=A0ACB7ZUX1_9AGAM|nr:hypothetical protein BJ138DRAFT_1119693 [Hygrophoropsis aurantiaca]
MVNPSRKFDFANPTEGQLQAIATGLQPSSYLNSRGMSSHNRGVGFRGLALSLADDDSPALTGSADDEDIVITDGPTHVKAKTGVNKKKGENTKDNDVDADKPSKPLAKRLRPRKPKAVESDDDDYEGSENDEEVPAKKMPRKNTAAQKTDLENAIKMETLRVQIEALNASQRTLVLQETELQAKLKLYGSQIRLHEQEAMHTYLKSYSLARELISKGRLDKDVVMLPPLNGPDVVPGGLPSIPPMIGNDFEMKYVTEDIAGTVATVKWHKPTARLPAAPTLGEEIVPWLAIRPGPSK